MARCGCAGSTCNCVVTAGPGVTVTGAGTPTNPYVVSSDSFAVGVADTPTLDLAITGTGTPGDPFIISGSVICDGIAAECGIEATNLSPLDTPSVDMVVTGTGTGGDPFIVSANVIPDPAGPVKIGPAGVTVCISADANNEIILGTDGCLYAPTAAATVVTVLDTPTVDMTITGTGTPGDPFVISAVALGATPDCDDVNACWDVLDTPSVNLTKNVGIISADVIVDPNPLNLIDGPPVGATGLLATITTGCGLTGAGTPASPLNTDTDGAWGFLCPDTSGVGIFCDSTGVLRTACPPTLVATQTGGPANTVIAINLTPAFQVLDTNVGIAGLPNPSACSTMAVAGFTEFDVDFDLPGPGAQRVTLRYAGDDYMSYLNTSGVGQFDVHFQFNRGINNTTPPGGTFTSISTIQASGTAGTVANRVQWRSVVTGVTGCN